MLKICSLNMPSRTAERALAELWLCTERNNLPPPDLTIQFMLDKRVRLTVSTGESGRAVAILRAWAFEWRAKVWRASGFRAGPGQDRARRPIGLAKSARSAGYIHHRRPGGALKLDAHSGGRPK
jgi:hypothetical protein